MSSKPLRRFFSSKARAGDKTKSNDELRPDGDNKDAENKENDGKQSRNVEGEGNPAQVSKVDRARVRSFVGKKERRRKGRELDLHGESESEDIDYDAIADIAARSVDPSAPGYKPRPRDLGLDIGLDESSLYLTPARKKGHELVFDTAAPKGINAVTLTSTLTAMAPGASAATVRDARGGEVRPYEDSAQLRKEKKKRDKDFLKGWFGLARRQITPEMEKELKAIKLRANFDPKRFYKANDSNALPTHFAIATEVGGGMAAAGLERTQFDAKPRSGRSLLSTMLRDQKGQEYTSKVQQTMHDRGHASHRSGHGAPSQKGLKRGAARGGTWKNKRRK